MAVAPHLRMKRILLTLGFLLSGISALYAPPPSWWSAPETTVLDSEREAENYAPANLGQLKHVAKQAKEYLDASLPGGAGIGVTSLVESFEPRSGQGYSQQQIDDLIQENYAPANLGQLKAIAKPFYDRLLELSYDTKANLIARGYPGNWAYPYPWNPSTPVTENYAPANLGQLKMTFSFDLGDDRDSPANGLPDWWERHYLSTTGVDPNGDSDGDGISNLLEYQNQTDPSDYYNGALPEVTSVSGDGQVSPANTFLDAPLVVLVKDGSGDPLENAPVVFTVVEGGGKLALTGTGSPSATTLSVRTGADGKAAVYYKQPIYGATPSEISATAGTAEPLLFTAMTDSLIGHWTFEESSGNTVTDVSGAGNHGTLVSVNRVPGLFGANAIDFTGGTSSMGFLVSNNSNRVLPVAGKPFSISIWMKARPLPEGISYTILQNETYLQNGFRYALTNGPAHVVDSGLARFWASQSGGTLHMQATKPIIPEEWYHLVVTYDGTTGRIYINGTLDYSHVGTISSDTKIIWFGSKFGGPILNFNGLMDDIRIYAEALSGSKITDLYQIDEDQNEIPDWWERRYFGQLGINPEIIPEDGSGLTYREQSLLGINPHVYENVTPVITIREETKFAAKPGERVNPCQVRVTDPTGQPLINAPVRFTVSTGDALLFPVTNSQGAGVQDLLAITDGSGTAKIAVEASSVEGEMNKVVASVPGATVEIPVVATYRVGFWSFDEGAGASIKDTSGFKSHGTLSGTVNWVVGDDSLPELQLNGTNNAVSIPNAPSLNFDTGAMTISTFVKLAPGAALSTTSHWYPIVAKGPVAGAYFTLSLRGGSYRGIFVRTTGGASGGGGVELIPSVNKSAIFLDNQWHHVAYTRDALGNACLYLDGELIASRTGMSINITSQSTLGLGGHEGNRLKGSLQQVELYAKALSADDIQQRAADRDGNGLLDWWEQEHFGTAGTDLAADPDGDGLSNLTEYLAGKDPSLADGEGTPGFLETGLRVYTQME